MKVCIARTLWGLKGFENLSTYKQTLQQIKNKGYNAIEVAITFTSHREEIVKIAKELDLGIITQIHTCSYPQSHVSVEKHLDSFKKEIDLALQWNPVLINSHSGRDAWNESQNLKFFQNASEYQKQIQGVDIVHETHRQRSFFTPYITKKILQEVEDIRINLDISHWHVVSERALDEKLDPEWVEIYQLVQQRASQIHARVGTAQSIQTNDPSQQEHQQDVEWYMNIWKGIIEKQKVQGKLKNFYITTEFGPYPYQPVKPQSMEPLEDLEKCNDYIKDLLQQEFKSYL